MGFELCVVRPHLDPVATTTVNRFLDDGEYIRGEALDPAVPRRCWCQFREIFG